MRRAHDVILSLPILFIPLEVWGEILSHLRLRDLFQCASVCLEWHTTDLINKSIIAIDEEECIQIDYERLGKMVNLLSLELDSEETRGFDYTTKNPNLNHSLRMLVNLRSLGLIFVTNVDNETITSLTNLTALSLGNAFFGALELTTLPYLKKLSIGICNASINDEGLGLLTNLTDLRMTTWCLLKGNSLSNLKCLERLYMVEDGRPGRDAVTDELLHGLTNLTEITLKGNTSVTKSGLSALTKLETLSLYRNHTITAQDVNGLPSLRTLTLGQYNRVDAKELNKSILVVCTLDLGPKPHIK